MTPDYLGDLVGLRETFGIGWNEIENELPEWEVEMYVAVLHERRKQERGG